MSNRKNNKKGKSLEDKIKEFIVVRLSLPIEPGEIGDNQRLFSDDDDSLHLSSIDALELAVGVKQEFDIILEEDINPAMLSTVAKIAEFIRTKMPDLLDEYADYEVDQ